MKPSLFRQMEALRKEILTVRYTDIKREAECCWKLLELATQEKDLYSRAFAHTYLGDAFIAQNNVVDTVYHLQQARILCESQYPELLMRVYNMLGISYEAMSDEQSALQYYLQALQVSNAMSSGGLAHIIYNNIGSNFEMMGDFETAKEYYLKACELFEKCVEGASLHDAEYVKLRFWGNLAQVCGRMGDYEEMLASLEICEKLQHCAPSSKRMILCRGWCTYYAGVGQDDKAVEQALDMLACWQQDKVQDAYLAYEMLHTACQTMIDIKRAECAKVILDAVLDLVQSSAAERVYQAHRLNAQYFEVFGSEEEQAAAYKEYYRTMVTLNKTMNASKINGLKNILHLDKLKNSLAMEKESLQVEAHLDELTRLYNRRYLNKLMTKAQMDPNTRSIGCVMLDIDYFKEYNDTYGHAGGDSVLRCVAEILQQSAVDGVAVSRYGGDEFVCLCVNVDKNIIVKFICAVRAALAKRAIEHSTSHCAEVLTLSIGYSNRKWYDTKEACDVLLHEADQALYASKAAGRNTFTGEAEV